MTHDHPTPEIQELDNLILAGEQNNTNQEWQGNVLLFMARRVRYMMERDTMTIQDCQRIREACPGASIFNKPQEALGPYLIKAAFTHAPWIIILGILWWILK
jgi:hypothetical protein